MSVGISFSTNLAHGADNASIRIWNGFIFEEGESSGLSVDGLEMAVETDNQMPQNGANLRVSALDREMVRNCDKGWSTR
jgi:hypothetical protein